MQKATFPKSLISATPRHPLFPRESASAWDSNRQHCKSGAGHPPHSRASRLPASSQGGGAPARPPFCPPHTSGPQENKGGVCSSRVSKEVATPGQRGLQDPPSSRARQQPPPLPSKHPPTKMAAEGGSVRGVSMDGAICRGEGGGSITTTTPTTTPARPPAMATWYSPPAPPRRRRPLRACAAAARPSPRGCAPARRAARHWCAPEVVVKVLPPLPSPSRGRWLSAGE